MLSSLVVVDYIEGAGGEFLSQTINRHNGFSDIVVLQKWFNSERHIIPNWEDEFAHRADAFVSQCETQLVNNIAVSYHLCFYPEQIEVLRLLSDNTRFVKIDSTGYANMVKMDFVRKVLFNRINKTQIREVKYRIRDDRGPLAHKLLNLLMNNQLLGIDLVLYKRKLDITKDNRESVFNQLMEKTDVCPTNDITISYEDFFVNLDNLKKSYYNLCNSLNIVPSEAIAESMLIRNTKNLEEVTTFTKNFDLIKHDIFSTTL